MENHRRRNSSGVEFQTQNGDEEPVKSSYRYLPRGIKNETGSCYLASALQCVLAMDIMREKFAKPKQDFKLDKLCNFSVPPFDPKPDGRLTFQIKKLFAQRCGVTELSTKPSSVAPVLKILNEYDSKLFPEDGGGCPCCAIRAIFEILHEEETGRNWSKRKIHGKFEPDEQLNDPDDDPHAVAVVEDETSFLNETFRVDCCFTVACRECNYTSDRRPLQLKTFYLLINRVPDEKVAGEEESDRKYTISDLLAYGCLEEVMLPHREKCSRQLSLQNDNNRSNVIHDRASVEFSLTKAPPVLVIKLGKGPDGEYQLKKIKIEETLDLTPFVDPAYAGEIGSCKYKLIAGIPFFKGAGGPGDRGHGMALIRHSKYPMFPSGRWYVISDEQISHSENFQKILDLKYLVNFNLLVYEKYSDHSR